MNASDQHGDRAGDADRTWRLPTESGEYVVGLTPDGAGLMLRHWGEPRQDVPPAALPRRTTSFESERDLLPLETTALGTRSVHSAEIIARRTDGLRGARLHLRSDVVVHHGDTTHLTCPLVDENAGLEVDLHIRTSTAHDVVEKWATIGNTPAPSPPNCCAPGAVRSRSTPPAPRSRSCTGTGPGSSPRPRSASARARSASAAGKGSPPTPTHRC
ncbi:glycoside hydrolase family 36 N-terminal domain-containing protein [Sanguibacter sp. Z1732]|uniref:glycoside hydrolase family 36 N-terminal domain-containing protein n=1 Tax=Sanguibacter sp. Z1732 TaxID=3435412 RepID=UPI003D9CA8A9